MKARTAIALGVVAGFALGATSTHTLYAQAKAPAFLVVEIDPINPEHFAKEYSPKAQAMTRKYGGKVLAASNNVTTLAGAPAKRMAVIQHESVEQIMAWNNAPEQQELRKLGETYVKFRFVIVPGLPPQQ
jgi:uncharacterized protein (DUF1330 family)